MTAVFTQQPPLLEMRNVTAGYKSAAVLSGLNLCIEKGTFLAIAGPNGAGKSTALKVLAGLLVPSDGTVLLSGQPLSKYSRRRLAQNIAVVFQDFSCPYEFTVQDLISLGRSPFLAHWRPFPKTDTTLTIEAMVATDVHHLRTRSFFELSGGEKQRVLIAKALAQQPCVLLLDEPATHLDLHHQVRIFDILHQLNTERGVTLVCVTHNLSLASQYIQRLLLLKNGYLIADGHPREIVTKEVMESLFQVPVRVGRINGVIDPFIYPLRKKI